MQGHHRAFGTTANAPGNVGKRRSTRTTRQDKFFERFEPCIEGADLLIQKRADGKYHSARLWANTCCTHPLWGEPVDQSAKRRLQEELGFTTALKPAHVITYRAPVSNGLIEHEQVHVFRGELADDSLIIPNEEEVSAVRWSTPAALQAAARRTPGEFAPWFRIYLERWPELGL